MAVVVGVIVRDACFQPNSPTGRRSLATGQYPPHIVIGPQSQRMAIRDPKHVSTSFVERKNLSMRTSIRRFTRLTNAFSKKIENHAAAVAIWFMYYNFCRVHSTLRVTPAMEAGLTDHVRSIAELLRAA